VTAVMHVLHAMAVQHVILVLHAIHVTAVHLALRDMLVRVVAALPTVARSVRLLLSVTISHAHILSITLINRLARYVLTVLSRSRASAHAVRLTTLSLQVL
jgi:hypothetical protein